MSLSTRTLGGRNWEVQMSNDKLTNVIMGVVASLWMAWTFATIQSNPGNTVALLLPALAVGFLAILMVTGHRINYLRIGDWAIVEMDHRRDQHPRMDDEEQERHR